MNYELVESCPAVDEYVYLRASTGLSPRSIEAAKRGLPNTWFGVSIRQNGKCIAMGRIVGDDGTVFHMCDLCVLPAYQRQGLASLLMQAMVDKLRKDAPAGSIVTMLADGETYRLYEKYGFQLSAPGSLGMLLRL